MSWFTRSIGKVTTDPQGDCVLSLPDSGDGDPGATAVPAVPSGAATYTNFKALANMANAGGIHVRFRGTSGLIPWVLRT